MNSNSFCNMPFNSLEISPDGTCQVCCKIKKPVLDDSGTPFNLSSSTLEEIWQSNDLKKLRRQFDAGEKPVECELCWTEERSENISLRHHSFRLPKQNEPKVEYLVLKLSNLCNLKCRICGPELSTQWLSELEKNGWLSEADKLRLDKNRSPKLGPENTEIMKQWVHSVKRLLAYGGEPFLSEELKKVLQLCIDEGVADNIFFTANTNGTVYNKPLIETLKKFKDVCLLFSIDDVDAKFEFQRKNASWNLVKENLLKFHELEKPVNVGLFPTVSILNIFSLKDYLEWTLKFPKFKVLLENTLHEPKHFSVRNAPAVLKKKMIASLANIDISKYNVENLNCLEVIKNFIQLEPQDSFRNENFAAGQIHHFLSTMDKVRNENYRQLFPELSEII